MLRLLLVEMAMLLLRRFRASLWYLLLEMALLLPLLLPLLLLLLLLLEVTVGFSPAFSPLLPRTRNAC
jgi:hypothetical protein